MTLSMSTLFNCNSTTGKTYNSTYVSIGVSDPFSSPGIASRVLAALTIVLTENVTIPAGKLRRIELVATEAYVGYWHKFLFSFDNGVSWWTYNSGGWRVVGTATDVTTTNTALANTYGIPYFVANSILEWPSGIATIKTAILINMPGGYGTGSLTSAQMEVSSGGLETISLAGEPAMDTILAPGFSDPDFPAWTIPEDAGVMPDFPLVNNPRVPALPIRFEGGTNMAVSASTRSRRVYEATWANRPQSTTDFLYNFLMLHRDIAFELFADTHPAKFICTEPQITRRDLQVSDIRCTLIEVF